MQFYLDKWKYCFIFELSNKKIRTMRTLARQIENGVYHFSSGTTNSEEFHIFFDKFKKSFTRELRKIKATKIEFNKGHFYLYGFFTVQGQVIYFSISDVRSFQVTDWRGIPQMLVRTAKDYKDFSGGHNRYVTIEPNMSKEILRVCNLDTDGFTKPTKKFLMEQKKLKKLLQN